ncbi:hypothetical protein B0D95_13175 [Cellvibrio sp. PSBB023]|nr:hypothetical protein B0D95_13175 [Cellvibrio sp. PSBB023]
MLSAFFFLVIYLISSVAIASVDTGVAWLKSKQGAQGEFYSPQTQSNPQLSTLESLSTLVFLNKTTGVNLVAANEFVAPSPINYSTEHLAKTILIKHGLGAAYAPELSSLAQRQMPYSGFGYGVGYEADPLSTALALEVVAKVGSENPGIGYAIQYLLETQKSDGSWSLENNTSNITLTAQVMKAVWGFRNTYAVSSALQKANNYLLAQRVSGGLWPELNTSAHALIVLLNYTNDRSGLTASVNALASAQLNDGSFNGDVYTTALALYALHLASLPAPDEITLSGKLIDGQSGNPLVGATVEITGVSSESQLTNSAGVFAFKNLAAGSYFIKATSQGYGSITLTTLVFKGSKPDLGVLKLTKLAVDPVTGTPVTTGTVRGVVTDRRTSSPVSGAVVGIPSLGLTATTDANGAYQISNVAAGNLSLIVAKSGYADVSTTAKLTAQQTLLFSPSLQESVALGVSVNGVISEYGTDTPLVGAKIDILKEGVVVASALSDAAGQYVIQGITAADIEIEVALTEYHPVSASAKPKDGNRLEFSPKLTLISQPPVLTTGGIIGTVVDSVTGRGIESVAVAVTYDTGAAINLVTGIDGEFSISDMESGRITIELIKAGYQSMQAQFNTESGLIQDLGSIQFNPVSAVTSGKLFGYVTDVRTSQPISAAIVSVKNTVTNQLLEVVSGSDGTFNFPVVPAGTQAITVKATGYTQVDFASIISAGDEIDLGNVLMRKLGIDALIPDVAVLAIDSSALVSDVASFTASGTIGVTLINRGNASVEIPFTIYAFEDLNNNGTYDAADTLLGQVSPVINQSSPLAVDGTISTSITVSGTLSFRDAPISILLDATNVLVELSEANNLSSTAGLCSNQQKPNVDLALCMDSSGSVSAADFKLQLEGTAQAIENVVPRDGTVRISALQFDSSAKVELNPTIIEEDNVQVIADKIRAIRKSGGGTSIHACIDSATTLITKALPASSMQIIDVSTDGQSTQTLAVAASNRAKTAGVDVLNSIGVGTGISTALLNAIVFPQPVGGDRGFVLTVKNYQEYMNGITNKIQRETKIADLTLGGAKLIDHGFGANPDATVKIGNAGATTITESITVSVYDAQPESGGQLIASQVIEADLPSGGHLDVTFTTIDPAKFATGKMVVVAKLSGDFPECNSNNNRQEIPVASKRGDIELSLNANTFGPNVGVHFSNVVTNVGALNGHYSVSLVIKDNAGIEVHSFAVSDINNLQPNTSVNLPNQWNTSLTAAGHYSATASLFDAQGVLLDSDTEAFVISELDGNGDPLGRVSPFTDKLQYHIDDRVVVGYSIENITRTHTINNPIVSLIVSSPTGATVYENTIPYSSLLPEQLLQWQQSFDLSRAAVGTYQVIATLKDASDVVYGVGVSTFIVDSNPELALRGNVTVTFAEIDSGGEQQCDFTVINASSSLLQNQNIRYSVVNVDSQLVKSDETSVLNFGVEEQIPHSKNFATPGFSAGTYACVLEVLRGSEAIVLATATFTVKESSIQLAGDIDVGEKARLLVLMDASSTERTYLENLLTQAGWFYTIVDNAAAFATELNQGGYGVYALLSEKVTLDQATQHLLDINVAAGDGLIVAGATDRHQMLEQALGIKARANEAYAKGITVQEGALGYPWERAFNKSARVLNFTANGATVIGEYRNNLPGADTQTVLGALGAAGRYGNFAWDNFTSLSSTIEGRIAVGGSLSLQNFSVGDKLDLNKLHDVVTVGGSVTFPSGRIYYGNLIAGGSVAGVGDAVRFGMAQGAVIQGNATMPINFTGEREYLQELSTNLANLPANGTVQMQWGGLELKGDCSSNSQVFNVNGADLGIAHTFAVSCIPAGATVVFNVSGQNVSIKSMGMQSLSTIRNKVLFNFPQATSLKMTSVGIEGSILAPFAQVDQPAGRIDGQVIVKSWYSTTNGYMSIHNRFFGGDLSAAVGQASKNALSIHQYEQGKSVFAGFDLLAQALALGAGNENPFAQLLLSALEHVNPVPITARAGKTIPVAVTYENIGAQAVTGQVKLSLSNNISVINAGNFSPVANSTDWVLPLNLGTSASQHQLIYVKLPASGSSGIQLQLQTGTAPDWATRLEKTLALSPQ